MTPEIRAFEFSLGLFAVLIGLAIADVATSFHKLVRHRSTVHWDPLALSAGLFALLISVGMWFDLWGIRNATSVRYFFFYLVLIAAFFLLFLIAAASLPDEPEGAVDLRTYYAENGRYFWSLVTAFELFYVLMGFYLVKGFLSRLPGGFLAAMLLQWLVLIAVPATLVFTRARWIHYLGLLVLFVAVGWHYARYSIN